MSAKGKWDNHCGQEKVEFISHPVALAVLWPKKMLLTAVNLCVNEPHTKCHTSSWIIQKPYRSGILVLKFVALYTLIHFQRHSSACHILKQIIANDCVIWRTIGHSGSPLLQMLNQITNTGILKLNHFLQNRIGNFSETL